MNLIDKKIEILTIAGFIPSGLNMPIEMRIQDVRATRYDYYGNKYSGTNEFYENIAVAIQIQHSKVELPFWITIFKGATYRDELSFCIIATTESLIDENYCIQTENNTVYRTDCMTEDDELEGLESIKEVLFAFKCRLVDGDESGLYTNGEGPTFNQSCVLEDTIDNLISLSFVGINTKLSKENPDIKQLKEINEIILSTASGKLYAVTVIHDYCIKAVQQFLKKEDAENIFITYCKKYYNENGLELYANRLGLDSIEELTLSQFELYFNSSEWQDVNDLSNVEINLM